MSERRRYPPDASEARGTGGGGRRGAQGRGREAAEPPTHSIADGTALHRGRVGSRHFQSPRGFFPEGSLFVSLRATGYLLTIFLFCLPLSVRLLISRFASYGRVC